MRVRAEQLGGALDKRLPPLCWLAGDEILLVQEAADLVRARCRDQGFTERQVFSFESGPADWKAVGQSLGAVSLFSQKKLVEIRLGGGRAGGGAKLDKAGQDVLHRHLDDAGDDLAVLVLSPRLDAATMKTKWFGRIEAAGVVAQIWPVKRDRLGPWLRQRLRDHGIEADQEALRLLTDRIEGNLLAAVQEIEKLKLMAGADGTDVVRLDAKTVMEAVAESSRLSVYDMIDAALSGDAARGQKILGNLRAERTDAMVALMAVARELRSLLPMVEKKEDGQPVGAVVQAARVWASRRRPVEAAVGRLGSQGIWRMLDHARLIDQSVKGISPMDPWVELSALLARLAGRSTGTGTGFGGRAAARR